MIMCQAAYVLTSSLHHVSYDSPLRADSTFMINASLTLSRIQVPIPDFFSLWDMDGYLVPINLKVLTPNCIGRRKKGESGKTGGERRGGRERRAQLFSDLHNWPLKWASVSSFLHLRKLWLRDTRPCAQICLSWLVHKDPASELRPSRPRARFCLLHIGL